MIFIISPAKTLNFDEVSSAHCSTEPIFQDEANRIMDTLKKKSVNKLIAMQDISRNLAELNFGRNQLWAASNNDKNSKQAISAFRGEVYVGLNESDFSKEDFSFAQDHLRILSGLYGILKPLDSIQPYRLEMGTQLKTTRGKNLYEFWKLRITNSLNEELSSVEEPVLINLASEEYFKSIKAKKLSAKVIQCVFMDMKNGKYKVISFFAKKARGLMSRYIIKFKITEPEDLKSFDLEGYRFNSDLSSEGKWTFTRNQE